ncbi:helix-turn-helix transcriptional regulator [Silicimonas sp. MF1-12-2]|uniref:helix-turn-helix transcriptional regulator n=1 Tax=Silicimonas sp. MF1-12-2 TaxID=3384793 RepID=UPI0039B4CC24
MFERDGGEFRADKYGPDLRVLDGIASWCGGLHGSMPLQDALTSLATGFRAEAAVLSRLHRGQERPRAVCIHDAQNSNADSVKLSRPLCQDVMGYLFTKARTSTIWFLSDHVEDSSWVTTQTLENWRAARNMREIVVVALEGNLQQQDYLEFHFTRDLAYSEKLELESLMPTLVRAWAGRKAGLVTQAQMDDRMIRARQAAAASKLKPDAPILGMSNPAKLTRAEFRVCVMLSRGLSVKALTDELGLSESTIRSHLRSIYSKTEVSGMQELMYRILSAAPEESGRARGRL